MACVHEVTSDLQHSGNQFFFQISVYVNDFVIDDS